MLWALGGIALLAVLGGGALQFAIASNGPAVLSSLDRLVGGDGGASLKATISTGDHREQKLVVWGPAARDPGDEPLPVLLFVHGGSWRTGDPDSYGFIGRAFVPKGFIVVLGGYRLGESGRYPAMLEDTARAITWTREEIAQYGGDPDKIVLAGHSAGAYNVVMAALEEQWLGRRGHSTGDIAGVVGLSGPYDFFPFDSDSTIAAFGDSEDPETTQPLAHVRDDAPPMLLIHGEKDTLVKPRNTHALASGLEQAGGTVSTQFYPEMNHNDPLISLAAPWRSRRDVADLISDFAHSVTDNATERDTTRDGASVPVQAETR